MFAYDFKTYTYQIREKEKVENPLKTMISVTIITRSLLFIFSVQCTMCMLL